MNHLIAGNGTDERNQQVETYYLLQAENQVDMEGLVSEVQGLDGVMSASRITGPFDVIAEAHAGSERARTTLAASVGGLPGVIRVVTLPTASSAGGSGAPRAA